HVDAHVKVAKHDARCASRHHGHSSTIISICVNDRFWLLIMHKDIMRLDVAVHNLVGVHVRDSHKHLAPDAFPHGGTNMHTAPLHVAFPLQQVAVAEEGHHHEGTETRALLL